MRVENPVRVSVCDRTNECNNRVNPRSECRTRNTYGTSILWGASCRISQFTVVGFQIDRNPPTIYSVGIYCHRRTNQCSTTTLLYGKKECSWYGIITIWYRIVVFVIHSLGTPTLGGENLIKDRNSPKRVGHKQRTLTAPTGRLGAILVFCNDAQSLPVQIVHS